MYQHIYSGEKKHHKLIRKVDCFLSLKDHALRTKLLFLDAGDDEPYKEFNKAEDKLNEIERNVFSLPDDEVNKSKARKFFTKIRASLKSCRVMVKTNSKSAFDFVKKKLSDFKEFCKAKDIQGKLKAFASGVKKACKLTSDALKKVSGLVEKAHNIIVSLNKVSVSYSGIDRKKLDPVTKQALKKLNSSSKEWLKNAKNGKITSYKKVSKSIDFLLNAASNERLNKDVTAFLDLSSEIISSEPVTTNEEEVKNQQVKQEAEMAVSTAESATTKNEQSKSEEIKKGEKDDIIDLIKEKLNDCLDGSQNRLYKLFNRMKKDLDGIAQEFDSDSSKYYDRPGFKGERFSSADEFAAVMDILRSYSNDVLGEYAKAEDSMNSGLDKLADVLSDDKMSLVEEEKVSLYNSAMKEFEIMMNKFLPRKEASIKYKNREIKLMPLDLYVTHSKV